MARYEIPDNIDKPLCTFICSCDHFQSAIKSMKFLENFQTLKVWRTEYPDNNMHSVWYVSFKHQEEPYIINVNICTTYFQLEFRHPQFLPNDVASKLRPNQKWVCANSNKYSELELQKMVSSYIEKIRDSFDKKQIKYRKWHPRKLTKYSHSI
jgi:hypothetical protein